MSVYPQYLHRKVVPCPWLEGGVTAVCTSWLNSTGARSSSAICSDSADPAPRLQSSSLRLLQQQRFSRGTAAVRHHHYCSSGITTAAVVAPCRAATAGRRHCSRGAAPAPRAAHPSPVEVGLPSHGSRCRRPARLRGSAL